MARRGVAMLGKEIVEMKLYTGDRIIDHRGRELCLSHRASVAGRPGWLAYPVRRDEVQRRHNAVVLDTEIRAVLSESGQFILAR